MQEEATWSCTRTSPCSRRGALRRGEWAPRLFLFLLFFFPLNTILFTIPPLGCLDVSVPSPPASCQPTPSPPPPPCPLPTQPSLRDQTHPPPSWLRSPHPLPLPLLASPPPMASKCLNGLFFFLPFAGCKLLHQRKCGFRRTVGLGERGEVSVWDHAGWGAGINKEKGSTTMKPRHRSAHGGVGAGMGPWDLSANVSLAHCFHQKPSSLEVVAGLGGGRKGTKEGDRAPATPHGAAPFFAQTTLSREG